MKMTITNMSLSSHLISIFFILLSPDFPKRLCTRVYNKGQRYYVKVKECVVNFVLSRVVLMKVERYHMSKRIHSFRTIPTTFIDLHFW